MELTGEGTRRTAWGLVPPALLGRALRSGWLLGRWCLGTHTRLPTPVWLHGGPLAWDHVEGRGRGLPAPSCCCKSFPLLSAGQLGGTLTQNSLLLPPVAGSSCRCSWELFRLCCILAARGGAGGLTAAGRGAGGREYWADSRWPLCKLPPRLVAVGTFLLTLPLWSGGLLAPVDPSPSPCPLVHPPLLPTELVRMVLNG